MKTVITIVSSLFILSNCGPGKDTSSSSSEESSTEISDQRTMEGEGYKSGVIQYSEKESDCPYTIKLNDADSSYLLDPINLTSDFSDFMKDGEKVWVKFTGLRMANRCEKANPISITDIKSR